MTFLGSYQPVVELFLLQLLLAHSQQVALKAGVLSFGTVGFAAVGAYVAGWLSLHTGIGSVLCLAAGVVGASATGLVVGFVARKLRSIYLATATLAFVLGLQSLITIAGSLTGGSLGMIGVPAWSAFGTLLAVAAGATVLVLLLDRTRFGRECDAIRSDEEAAGSIGVHVERNRALAMVISAALAGLGGGLQAGYSTAIFPTDFGFALMISVITYVILGGAGAWWGALIGTAVLVELFDATSGLGDARPFITGLVLVVVVFVAPRGLVGLVDELKGRWARRRLSRAGRGRPAAPEASRA